MANDEREMAQGPVDHFMVRLKDGQFWVIEGAHGQDAEPEKFSDIADVVIACEEFLAAANASALNYSGADIEVIRFHGDCPPQTKGYEEVVEDARHSAEWWAADHATSFAATAYGAPTP